MESVRVQGSLHSHLRVLSPVPGRYVRLIFHLWNLTFLSVEMLIEFPRYIGWQAAAMKRLYFRC
jgi:hypothetical protein